ncbi:MAG: N-acetylmuramoyl-L-alanine amidase, partial [Syntrophales bacterium]
MVRVKGIIVSIILLMALLLPSCSLALTKILNIRHWAAPDHTRIVIDTSEETQYNVERTEQKISIDLRGTAFPETIPAEIILSKPGIDRILLMQLSQSAVRIQLLLAKDVDVKVFKLKKFQNKPDRVVVDIEFPEIEKKESEERQQIKVLRKNKIIVIDPGHGGDDPGAIGKNGIYEKDIVLSISRKLRKIMNEMEGYRAFLTRDGDYYVPFKKRLKIAREYGADLFLSIHADASLNRNARGSSVYCLSTRGASSAAAKVLANKENLADIIGGSSDAESNNDEADPIILNMFQTNTINMSKCFGTVLLKHLDTVGRLKFHDIQEAPFIVLKLPEIPSALLETAYISNPKEEKMLQSEQFQEEIARIIASSVSEFFSLRPSAIPKLTITKQDGRTESSSNDSSGNKQFHFPLTYKIKKGDTLSKIAVKHNTTLQALLELNQMKLKDPLYVGRELKIGESKADENVPLKADVSPARKTRVSTYKIKKGDTLSKIAVKHNTTLQALLELNQMKLKDPLYVGREL